MAENPHHPISQTFRCGLNDHYILARATRKHDREHLGREYLASSSTSVKSQSDLRLQNCEVARNFNVRPAPVQSRIYLPLNSIVSKPATRKSHQENNADPSDGTDLSIIRNSKLFEPPWRDKEANRKRLQSAYFYNKRKIEEIQAMKAKMKYRRCGSTYLPKLGNGMDSKIQRNKTDTSAAKNLSQLDGSYCKLPQTEPLVMESEDPLPDDVIDNGHTAFEHVSNNKENFVFSSMPICHPTEEKFVWDPVILPVSKSFNDFLESCSPQFHERKANECFDSPGNRTTSSSSGFTIAEEEETVRFTYYAGRCRVPLKEPSQMRRVGDYSYMFDPYKSSVQEWRPRSLQPDSYRYFEE